MNTTKDWLKRSWFTLTCLLLVALMLGMTGVNITDRDSASGNRISIGVGDKRVITLGSVALAAGTVDYEFDGVADDVQFQAALNALPATGGRLVVVSATTIVFTAATTVTRAIDNVTIEGTGRGTYFTGDGVTAIFTAGGNNWKFEDIRVDAGGITMGATTGWMWTNVLDNATYYSYRSPAGQAVLNDTTVASLTDSGLTDTRVLIAGVAGLLSDDADLTFTGGNTLNSTNIGAYTLSGKLTAGASEIEGSTFDINGGDISVATVSGGLTWSAAQNFGAYTVYINDTTNANMSTGLTIQQAATADQSIALKDSGVATGLTNAVTNSVETDDYTTFSKFATATGGLMLQSLGENAAVTTNLLIESYGGQADTTKSSAGRALIEVYAAQHDGANALAAVAANGNIFAIRGHTVNTVAIVDEDGDLWLNGGITTGGATPVEYFANNISGTWVSGGGGGAAARLQIDGVLTGATGDTAWISQVAISGSIVTQTQAATIGWVSTLYLEEPVITKNVTTITAASTLFIASAPTEGTTNAAIYVASGDTNLNTLTARGNAQFNSKASIGVTGTGTGVLEIDGTTSGTVSVTVAAAAGTWTMTLPAAVGGAGEQLTDAAGNGVTSWAAAASRREYKSIIGESDSLLALDNLLNTKVYDFKYKPGMGTGDSDTLYTGVMADEAGWAMHYQGGIVNPVNTLGYLVLGTQALNDKIEQLEARIAQLEAK